MSKVGEAATVSVPQAYDQDHLRRPLDPRHGRGFRAAPRIAPRPAVPNVPSQAHQTDSPRDHPATVEVNETDVRVGPEINPRGPRP